MRPPAGFFLCLALSLGLGCDFFKELESADSAETGGETEGDTDVAAMEGECEPVRDDRCLNQDIVQHCDPDLLEASAEDCGIQCGSYVNFSCVSTASGPGCWCVDVGAQKVYSCTELESCLEGCVFAPDSTCSNRCFSRTTESTIRMYGALINCAYSQCHDMCIDNPQLCTTCIDSGIREGAGECGLQRSVCDQDRNDEPGYP
jgi:hypothetical protein